MSYEDSLVATRARRPNAGSRLKQLIELEEQSNDLQNTVQQIITEDDENVNLLFQEDENDEEFYDEDVDNENLQGIDEDDEEEEDDDGEEGDESEDTGTKKRSREEAGDDVLSDSDISMSDSDESEGEKELQKQEMLKKRASRKKHSVVPAIKKVKIVGKEKKIPKSKLITSDTLLLSMRRSSSRSAAVENKHALLQKLKANEKRRAQLTPIVRVKHVDLTQEEKLAEAVETEKANVLSLQQFQEQEIVKKEKQRQSLLSKRKHLANVVRLVSKESYVSPTEEVRQARLRHEYLVNKLKRKPGRRKKIQVEEYTRLPGEIDKELPLVKQELERKRKEEEEKMKLQAPSSSLEGDSANASEGGERSSEIPEGSKASSDIPVIPAEESGDKNEQDSKSEISNATNDEHASSDNKKEDVTVDTADPIPESIEDSPKEDAMEVEKKEDESLKEESIPTMEGNEPAPADLTVKIETSEEKSEGLDVQVKSEPGLEETPENSEKKPTKEVRFVEKLDSEVLESEQPETRENTPSIVEDPATEIFEGPSQKVSSNTIYLFDFNGEHRLDPTSVKSYIFGPESLLPASRRFKDLKTIIRIGKVDNPYAAVKEEKDLLFEPVSELTEDDPIFDELKRLPRLGVAQAVVEEVKEDIEAESHNIVLKTEAPTGLYLPNGNKKNCLISGTEVKYFDPANGIPYSSVETYKFLKQIEQGQIPWISLASEYRGSQPVELYYGSRDGSIRHAKGVPEGFDG